MSKNSYLAGVQPQENAASVSLCDDDLLDLEGVSSQEEYAAESDADR